MAGVQRKGGGERAVLVQIMRWDSRSSLHERFFGDSREANESFDSFNLKDVYIETQTSVEFLILKQLIDRKCFCWGF